MADCPGLKVDFSHRSSHLWSEDGLAGRKLMFMWAAVYNSLLAVH